MSKTGRVNKRREQRWRSRPERRITVRGVRRDPPDLRKLSRAVIALALAEAKAEAEAEEAASHGKPSNEVEGAHDDA